MADGGVAVGAAGGVTSSDRVMMDSLGITNAVLAWKLPMSAQSSAAEERKILPPEISTLLNERSIAAAEVLLLLRITVILSSVALAKAVMEIPSAVADNSTPMRCQPAWTKAEKCLKA